MDRLPTKDQVELLAREATRLIRNVLGDDVRTYWFGSWITGVPVERSDIDLAVDAGIELSGEIRNRIRESIDGMETLRKIDVLDLASVSDERREQILKEGRAL